MTSLNCAPAEALAGVPAVVLLAFFIVSHSLSSMGTIVEPNVVPDELSLIEPAVDLLLLPVHRSFYSTFSTAKQTR